MAWYREWSRWPRYVSVASRRAKATREMERLRKRGRDIQPVILEGRKIAHTFWGRAWCDHLEKFSDYVNRLPRGRSYVRNGSVCHLDIREGRIVAKVSGSELYDVKVSIRALPGAKWKRVREACAGQVGSMLELLQGRLSDRVMGIVTDRDQGLFPSPKEIELDCSCPDWAEMCKHVAAVLYGVGARLDQRPELLFQLRGVDHAELVSKESARAVLGRTPAAKDRRLDEGNLSQVFGIDLAENRRKARSDVTPAPRKGGRRQGNARNASSRVATPAGSASPVEKSEGVVKKPRGPSRLREAMIADYEAGA